MKKLLSIIVIIFSLLIAFNTSAKSETSKIEIVFCGYGTDIHTLTEVEIRIAEALEIGGTHADYWSNYCKSDGQRGSFSKYQSLKVNFKIENLCAELVENPKSSKDVWFRYLSTVSCNERSKLPGYSKYSKNVRFVEVKKDLVHVFEILDLTLNQKIGIEKKYIVKKPEKNNEITKKPEKKTDDSNNNQANLEEEKRKIEEEKKKIEEEKRKIAEAKKKQEEEEKQRKEDNAKLYIIGSGTGFFVSAEGHVVSNDHVVGICKQVASEINGEFKYFNVLKTDEVNDLGLIKGEYKSDSFLSIKSDGAEFGEDIVAFGYPLADALSTSVKLTRGIVSSLSGPGNNYSEIQIDAAIQPGNSGGPVMNMDGQVVGVASSGLNKLYMLEKSEYIPENVNFAVAAPTLTNFLRSNGVIISNQKFKIGNTKELANIGRPSTLQLFCLNTKAVHDELKEKKKHSDVLFEKVIEFR